MSNYRKMYRYAIPNIGTVDIPQKSHFDVQEGRIVTVVVNEYTFIINRHNLIEEHLKKND